VKAGPIEVCAATLPFTHDVLKMVGDDLPFMAVVSDPSFLVLKAMDVVLPSSSINFPMEEFGISIALSNVGDH
jgi:hypothetical protein